MRGGFFMSIQKPVITYDQKSDSLFIKVSDNSNSYCSDTVDGVNIFRDIESEQITGFLVFAFKKKAADNSLPLFLCDYGIDFQLMTI